MIEEQQDVPFEIIQTDARFQNINERLQGTVATRQIGHCFLRKAHVGSPGKSLIYTEDGLCESSGYPLQCVGLVEYRNIHEKQRSIGTIIGPNLVITMTPKFIYPQDPKNHQMQTVKYLKYKQEMMQFLEDFQLPVHLRKYKRVIEEEQEEVRLHKIRRNQRQKFNSRNNENYPHRIAQSESTIAENEEKAKREQQIRRQKEMLDDFANEIPPEDVECPQIISESEVYFYPDYPKNEWSHKYRVKRINYCKSGDFLPLKLRPALAFVSTECAILEIDTNVNMQEVHGAMGFDFHDQNRRSVSQSYLLSFKRAEQSEIAMVPILQARDAIAMIGSPLVYFQRGCYYIVGMEDNRGTSMELENNDHQISYSSYIDLSDQRRDYYDSFIKILRRQCQKIELNGDHIPAGNHLLFLLDLLRQNRVNLTYLSLQNTPIMPLVLKNAGHWRSLRNLLLDNNQMSSTTLKCLVKMDLYELVYLSLANSQLGNAGLSAISKATWPNLSALNISSNAITNDGINYLVKACWPNLKGVVIKDNMLTWEVLSKFLRADLYYLKSIHRNFMPAIGTQHEIAEQLLRQKFKMYLP